MMIKNYDRCIKPVYIDQPDLLVSKTGDKLIYSDQDSIVTYSISYQNISKVPIKQATIQDTL